MFDEIGIRHLPPQMQRIAIDFGVQSTVKMMQRFGGSWVYIPKVNVLTKQLDILSMIHNEYDGTNRKQLCKKLNISERTFYRYQNKQLKKKVNDEN